MRLPRVSSTRHRPHVARPGGAPRGMLRPFAGRNAPRGECPDEHLPSKRHSAFDGLTNTAIHPVKQAGKALFAGKGTNTKLFAAFTATECAVPAGCWFVPTVTAGTLYVGTS